MTICKKRQESSQKGINSKLRVKMVITIRDVFEIIDEKQLNRRQTGGDADDGALGLGLGLGDSSVDGVHNLIRAQTAKHGRES
ncbi:hypothetical protein K7432_002862, partial [Basidiobolus ranarum]